MFIIKLVCALLAGSLWATNAFAIAKEHHNEVTKHAVVVYQQCIQTLNIKDTLTDAYSKVSAATSLEDSTKLYDRLENWHFHDLYSGTQLRMGSILLGWGHTSLNHIFDKRIDSLIYTLDKGSNIDDIYEYSGRTVHYIQDMAVPAHVAPIFHYKFGFLGNADSFDDMDEWSNSKYTGTKDTCSITTTNLDALKAELNVLLDNAAQSTRKRMRENIGLKSPHKLSRKTWEYFWKIKKRSASDKNFSEYGTEGRDGFKNFCASEKVICKEFFQKSFNDAVHFSVKALLLINAINLKKDESP